MDPCMVAQTLEELADKIAQEAVRDVISAETISEDWSVDTYSRLARRAAFLALLDIALRDLSS